MAIIATTAIWGYSTVGIEQTVRAVPPSILMLLRFLIAAIVLSPVLIHTKFSLREWGISVSTGAAFGLAVLSQSYGLKTVSVDVVSFITGLYVVLTPLTVAFIRRRFPSPWVWSSVAASLIGVLLLIGRLTLGGNIGLVWSFLAAVASTAQIIGTASAAKTVGPFAGAGLQSVGATVVLCVVVLIQGAVHPNLYHGLFHWSTANYVAIGYQGIMAQVAAGCLQVWGQKRVSETDAALAFNLEPAMAAVFAWFLLHQGMTVVQIVGAALILASLSLVSFASE